MSKRIRYTEEFKRAAVSQVSARGHSIRDVSERLGISSKSLYAWLRHYGKGAGDGQQGAKQAVEIRRLKAELARVSEERDTRKDARDDIFDYIELFHNPKRKHTAERIMRRNAVR